MDYYLQTKDGKSAGPYSIDQIKSFWTEGRVTVDTPCWSQGGGWQSIRALENKFRPPVQAAQRLEFAPAKAVLPANPLVAVFGTLLALFLPPLGFLMGLMTLVNPAHRRYSPLILITSLILPAIWGFVILKSYQGSSDYGDWPKFVNDTLRGNPELEYETASPTTKEEWRAKVQALPQLNRTPGVHFLPWTTGLTSQHPQYYFSKDDVLKVVGSPDHSSSMGGDKYLYWECSNGEIQVVCSQDAYDNYNTVAGNINDY